MPDNFQLQGWWVYQKQNVSIGSAGTVSSTADLEVNTLCAVITPAALTNATMNFLASPDGTTFYPMYDKTNTAIALTVATGAAQWYPVNQQDFAGVRFLQAKMSGAEGAARTIQFVARPL